jgi:GABA permease
MLAVLAFMGLQPALASQLWLSMRVAGGFAAAFWLLRTGRRA